MAHICDVSAGHAGAGKELGPSVPFMWPSPSARENGDGHQRSTRATTSLHEPLILVRRQVKVKYIDFQHKNSSSDFKQDRCRDVTAVR